MIAAKRTQKFYGGAISRIFIVQHMDRLDDISGNTIEFIRNGFNSSRNYKEFNYISPLKSIVLLRSTSPINLDELKEGDAILLTGTGRVIDKPSYELALRCFEKKIPVFFIKSNNHVCDFYNSSANSHTSIVVKTDNGTKYYFPPEKYFMEISDDSKLTLCKTSDSLYALLPGMVPIIN